VEHLHDQTVPVVTQRTPPQPRPRLDTLQGLRGWAAVLVVIAHSISNYRAGMGDTARSVFGDFAGALGVCAFFVSGFLMVYAHGGDFARPGATKKFYSRRIARIVPLYVGTSVRLKSGRSPVRCPPWPP
jgi:exopolysaccharide production protein ExoZ